jgi:hypothetical protein
MISATPLTFGLMLFLLVRLFLSRRGSVNVGLCPIHQKRQLAIVRFAGLMGLGGLLAIPAASRVDSATVAPGVLAAGCRMLLSALILPCRAGRAVLPARVDKQYVWIKNVGPDYLATFAELGK